MADTPLHTPPLSFVIVRQVARLVNTPLINCTAGVHLGDTPVFNVHPQKCPSQKYKLFSRRIAFIFVQPFSAVRRSLF